jgi:hypothetical protein
MTATFSSRTVKDSLREIVFALPERFPIARWAEL